MMEGMVLKKKFDDVFESTRYTKALEAFSKAKKEFAGKGKDLKGELLEFGAHLLAASQCRADLAHCDQSGLACRGDLDAVLARIEESAGKLGKCEEQLKGAQRGGQDLQQLKWQMEGAQTRVKDQISRIEVRLPDSDHDLQIAIDNFQSAMNSRMK
jgi:DNA repair protein RAD50